MEMTTGERVARARKLRGLTQAQLSARVGRSASWVAKIERGHAPLDRRSVLDLLASTLTVEVVELTGQPYRPTTPAAQSGHEGIPALRLALQRTTMGLATQAPERPVEAVRADLVAVERARSDARFDDVAAALPGLVSEIHAGGWAPLMVRAGHLARVLASMTGHHDLAWVALTLEQTAATVSGDPLDLAAASWDQCGAWLHIGAEAEARATAQAALDALDGYAGTSDEIDAMRGALHLRAAVAESRRWDSAAAAAHVAAADAIGVSATGHRLVQTAYTPENRRLHALEVAVELGRPRDPLALVERIMPARLSGDERVAHYWVMRGQASHLAGDREDAVAALVAAHRVAGPHVATRHPARELTRELVARGRYISPELRSLAAVMGA